MNNVIEHVREFIKTSLMVPEDINDNTSLMSSGVIDSMGIIEVISFIEDNYSIVVGDDEVSEENFDSIEKIAFFIQNRL